MKDTRKGPHNLYKGRFFIVFYDDDDDTYLYSFDNVRDILKFQQKDFTRMNVSLLNVELYRALRRPDHSCKFLTGEPMRVYIFEQGENDE